MKKITLAALAAITISTGFAGSAAAQVSDDVNIDLTVTAQPQISITPTGDISFTSDGITASPTNGVSVVCINTGLTDIRFTIGMLNANQNGSPALVNASIPDFINYNIAAGVVGVGGSASFNENFNTLDYDLTSASTGLAPCATGEFAFVMDTTPQTNPQFADRAISEAVAGSGLADGTPYAFSDVITLTFEPTL